MRKTLFLILAFFFVLSCTHTSEIEKLHTEIDVLKLKNDSLKIVNDSLTQVLNEENPMSNPWFHEDYDGRELRKRGIFNPEKFIKESLRKNPELIPLKAVLGGTMTFGNIQVLGRKWVIAEYEDGHILGRGIFKYRLNDNDEPEFEILDSID